MLTTIPPTLHSPGGLRTPAPGSPQHTLPAAAAAAASASRPRRPVSRRLCAAAGATSSRAPPHARQRDAVAWSTGPTALRPSGPSLPAAARERLRPQPRRATRGTQLPAPSWPKKPFSTGRWAPPLPTTTWGHGTQLPARVAALCRAARRGRREPRSPLRQPVGVGAWAAGRPGAPQAPALVGQGRGVAKEALARPWRPCARRPQRAQSGWRAARGEGGRRWLGRAPRPGASPKGGGTRPRALGGLAAGQRATAATKKGVWPPRRGIEPRSPA